MKAVVLGGGPLGELPLEPGDEADCKGMIQISGQPMALRTLQAVLQATEIDGAVLVCPQPPGWELPRGFDWAPSQPDLMGSFEAGVLATGEEDQPVLVCCGDLPLVTAEALDDFVRRCRRRPEAGLWYGFLRQENSLYRYPRVGHTWARLQDGTFCGSGVMMLRPRVMKSMRAAMDRLTHARKNMLKLAHCLGWGNLLNYALGRLTVARAEKAGQQIFGVPCAGIETPYAELGFNVDDAASLAEARRLLGEAPQDEERGIS